MMRFFGPALGVIVGISPVWAEDVALIIGNENYANDRDIRSADEILDAGPALEDLGFRVIEGEDATAETLRNLFGQFEAQADGAGRLVIALTGHFAQSASQSWFLASDANRPGLGSAGSMGVSLDVIMELASRAPGQAVVLLGTEDRRFSYGAGLGAGFGTIEPPQGVTVVTGAADDIADFATDALGVEGRSVATALADWPSLTGRGFLAPLVPFMGSNGAATVVAPDLNATERSFWDATRSIGTIAGYESYLDRYENGQYAPQAREEIARLKAEPGLLAEADEKSLKLNRNARREIQRSLSLLGYNTRGIDGVFGRGTRAAIGAWQRDNREEVTGFVTRGQLDLLQAQADRRASELEEEARLRQAEIERQDRIYWDATGARGDEAGLRAYLDRYPDGVFAEIATTRLQPFEDERREAAQAQDRGDWDRARSVGTVEAYREYLRRQPDGAFADAAQAEVRNLADQKNNSALEAARRGEENLRLNQNTRRLVEDRLNKLGLKPGRVDGKFDDRTRRAIRRYQQARGLTKTGYLNQRTVVRLLADSILR